VLIIAAEEQYFH